MRTIGKRKAKNQPCKSPSPDVANRSIIKNTTIQIADVKAKMRQAESRDNNISMEGSPSHGILSDLNRSFEIKYRIAEEQMNKVQIQNQQLFKENQLLKQENKRLRQHSPGVNTSRFGQSPSNNSKESLHDRILHLDSQKIIFLQQINNQKYANQQKQRYIQSLRKDLDHLNQTNKDYQGKIISLSNRMVSLNQQFISKINELHSRINKLQTLKRVINEKHSRIVTESRLQQTPTSTKHDYKPKQSTGIRNPSPQGLVFTYSPKPFMKEQDQSSISEENYLLKKQVLSKQDELDRLRLKKQNFMMIMKNPQQSSLNYYQEIEELKHQNKTLRSNLNEKECEHQDQRNKLLNIIEHHKTLLKGYEGELTVQNCELCALKDKQLFHLKQNLERNQKKYSEQLNNIQFQSRMKIKQLQNVIQANEQNCSLQQQCERLTYENNKIASENQKMKDDIKFIVNKFNVDDAASILDQNYSLYRQLDKKVGEQQQFYQKTLADLRQKLYLKEEENATLEKELSLKIKEVQYLQIELHRIKELQRQYKHQNQQSATTALIIKSTKNREKIQNNSQFRNNQLQLLEKIQEHKEQLAFVCQHVDHQKGQQETTQ